MSKKLEFSESPEQEVDRSVSFESFEVEVRYAQDGKTITDKEVVVRVYFHNLECISQSEEPLMEVRGKEGKFMLRNMYSTTYTIFAKADDLNYSCKRVTLTDHFKTSKQVIYLHAELNDREVRAVLEWNSNSFAKINLLTTLLMSPTEDCTVGYLNDSCPHISYERASSWPFYESIKLDRLGPNDYLFFVKQSLSQEEYTRLASLGYNKINQIISQSGARISIYVAGFTFPVHESGISEYETNVEQEDNLAWIVACMNGSLGNKILPINKYWTLNSKYDYMIKRQYQQLPPAEICQKYIQSLSK